MGAPGMVGDPGLDSQWQDKGEPGEPGPTGLPGFKGATTVT